MTLSMCRTFVVTAVLLLTGCGEGIRNDMTNESLPVGTKTVVSGSGTNEPDANFVALEYADEDRSGER